MSQCAVLVDGDKILLAFGKEISDCVFRQEVLPFFVVSRVPLLVVMLMVSMMLMMLIVLLF